MAIVGKAWVPVQVTGRVFGLKTGRIKLSKEQARKRAHALKPVKGKVYEVIAPVEFKRGEEFEVRGDLLSKMALVAVTPLVDIETEPELVAGKAGDVSDPDGEDGDAGDPDVDDDEPAAGDAVDVGDPTAAGLLKQDQD